MTDATPDVRALYAEAQAVLRAWKAVAPADDNLVTQLLARCRALESQYQTALEIASKWHDLAMGSEAENTALRADTARLDWLAQHRHGVYHTGGVTWIVQTVDERMLGRRGTIREAIDDAMQP